MVEQEARGCLGSFGLQGKVASDTPLSQLSGGQKVRSLASSPRQETNTFAGSTGVRANRLPTTLASVRPAPLLRTQSR